MQIKSLIEEYILPKETGRVLDIGCGAGFFSLFLSRHYFNIDAIDINELLILKLNETASKEKLSLHAQKKDVREMIFPDNFYDVVLAINSLIFIKKSDLVKVIQDIKKTLKNRGVCIISGFSVDDPSFKSLSDNHSAIEVNTFLNNRTGQYWNFLEANELKSYFSESNFNVLVDETFIVNDQPHDNVPYPHTHGISQIVVQKK